ncbi:TPA: AraC family transcriptional regulator [Elizabethkingia anophelis]|nr:AraC family transcriptional regulator [Elizabethkingia anophelis]
MKDSILISHNNLKHLNLKLKGFRVFEVEESLRGIPEYSRKDFYKICLHNGDSIIHYADKSVSVKGYTLFFGTPYIPYSWDIESEKHNSYTCIFTEGFLSNSERLESLHNSPLFKVGGTPVFHLEENSYQFIKAIFEKMLEEQDSIYHYKDELIRNYINLIIHEAHKMQPQENYFTALNASSRISGLFMELLERQFPVESPNQPLFIKSPNDFAERLNIHVNHLNRSVKEITGKTTKDLITERIITEAKELLRYTDWSITNIAYALGYEYPTYFNNFFKRMTGDTPNNWRKSVTT